MLLNIYNTPFGRFLLDYNDNISKHLIDGKFWEPELLPIFNELDENSVVVEVGSYIGDHTVYLAKRCKKVYAFEGQYRNYVILLTNLLLNGLLDKVDAYNVVVGNMGFVREPNSSEDYPIDFETNASGARFLASGEEDIPTIPIDFYLLDEKVDLLKVDAEGMDLEILISATRLITNYRPIIVFEYNGWIDKNTIEDYHKFLDSLNYSYKRIGEYNWLAEYKGDK